MTSDSPHSLAGPKAWLISGGAALAVLLLDQSTKLLAVSRLEGRPPIVVVGDWLGSGIGPLLQLRLIRNPGAAFGLGAFGPWSTLALSLVAIVVVVVLVRFVSKIVDPWWALALGLLLGGALGNLIDRFTRTPGVLRGKVVDFLELPSFPVFNVADMALTSAVIIILVLTVTGRTWSSGQR